MGWSPALCSPGCPRSFCRDGGGAGAAGVESGPSGLDEGVPGPAAEQSEPLSASAADDASGDGQEPEAEAFGFPAPCGLVVPGERLGPDQQISCEGDDLQPDLILSEAVEGQVPQTGVLQPADPVLGAGALAVPDLERGQRPAGAAGVGGKAGDPPALVVGQPQLRAGVRAFAAGDDPHPGRPTLESAGE